MMDIKKAVGYLPALEEKLISFLQENGSIILRPAMFQGIVAEVGGHTMNLPALFSRIAAQGANFMEKKMLESVFQAQKHGIRAAADQVSAWAEEKIKAVPGEQADRLAIGLTKSEGKAAAIACNAKGDAFALYYIEAEIAAALEAIGEEE
jgi:hypothetical protein